MSPKSDIEDAPLRRCGRCGAISSRWYAYSEEPVASLEGMDICSSKIICWLCIDWIVKRIVPE